MMSCSKIEGESSSAIDKAVVANIQYQVQQKQNSTILSQSLLDGQLKIVAGRYDLDTGTNFSLGTRSAGCFDLKEL